MRVTCEDTPNVAGVDSRVEPSGVLIAKSKQHGWEGGERLRGMMQKDERGAAARSGYLGEDLVLAGRKRASGDGSPRLFEELPRQQVE
jgi:hypothetical protein